MADSEAKRSIRSAQPKRRRLNTRQKHRLYEALYDLNVPLMYEEADVEEFIASEAHSPLTHNRR